MLLKLTALTLGLVVSPCFAATFQKCGGFLDPIEGSEYTPSLSFKAGKNDGASVLVFELKDSLNTNIDLNGIDDSNLLNSTNNNFFLCTQEFLDAGKCDELGTFNLEIMEKQQIKKQIMNKHLEANEKVEYQIDAKGVYCVATYSKVKHNVEVIAMQSFGHASLEDHYRAEFLKYLVIPVSVAVAIMSYKLCKKTPKVETPLEHSIFSYTVLVALFKVIQYTNIESYNSGRLEPESTEFIALGKAENYRLLTNFESAFGFIFLLLLSSWALGFHILKKNPAQSLSFFFVAMWFQFCDSQLLHKKYGISYCSDYYGYLKSIIELVLIYKIYKKSQETLHQIEVPDVKRRFKLSITTSLLIPLFIGLTCVFVSVVIGLKNGRDITNNYTSWKYGQEGLLVEVIEKTSMSRELVYLSSLRDLVYVCLGFAYTWIWSGKSPKQEVIEKENSEIPKKLPVIMTYTVLNVVAMVCTNALFNHLENLG